MTRIIFERCKAKLQVELPSRFVDGVDFHRPDSKLRCKMFGAAQRTDQQQTAESLPVNALVHGQSS
jgi:hypothetical protein